MPPKPKFTPEEVVEAAFGIARKNGAEGVTVSSLKEALGVSASPIFTLFRSVEEIRDEVRKKAFQSLKTALSVADGAESAFLKRAVALVRFAREEPALFRLLFLSENQPWEKQALDFPDDLSQIRQTYSVTEKEARRLFERLWVTALGFSVFLVSGSRSFSEKEVTALLDEVFSGAVAVKNENPASVSASGENAPVFRLAMESDLPALYAVYEHIIDAMRRNGLSVWDEIYPTSFFFDDIAIERLWLLWEKNAPIAAFSLLDSVEGENAVSWKNPDAQAVYLARFGVDPNRSRRGIGSEMLQRAADLAKELGASYLRLFVVDANTPAIRFYEKNGFTRVPGYFREIIDDDLTLPQIGFEKKL